MVLPRRVPVVRNGSFQRGPLQAGPPFVVKPVGQQKSAPSSGAADWGGSPRPMATSFPALPAHAVLRLLSQEDQSEETFWAVLDLLEHVAALGQNPLQAELPAAFEGTTGLAGGNVGETESVGRAWLRRLLPTSLASFRSFYTPEAAKRLLALDPELYAFRTGKTCWLWERLNRWERLTPEEQDADGIVCSEFDWWGIRDPSFDVDRWAVRVVDSLPQQSLEGEEGVLGWRGVVGLGLAGTAAAMAARNPALWQARSEHGHLILGSTQNGDLWDRCVSAGTDPHAIQPNGKPFWYQLVGSRGSGSASAPEPQTLRDRVECWIRAESVRPDAGPDLRQHSTELMISRIRNAQWLESNPLERWPFVAQGSTDWVWEPIGSCPAWSFPLLVQTKQSHLHWTTWVNQLKGHDALRAAIGPPLDLASWLLHETGIVPDAPALSPEALNAAVMHPFAAELVEQWVGIWCTTPSETQEVRAAYAAVRLDQGLAAAGQRNNRPRM